MFSFKSTGSVRGDCTAPYDVILDKTYTVEEFVEAVLTIHDEWGYIGISKKGAIFGDPKCEYRYGELITEPLPDNVLNRKVKEAKASGGYTRMDYFLKI